MPNPILTLSIAGLIAAICALLFWPARGLYPRWQQARLMTDRVLSEDALKHIYKCQLGNRRPTLQSIAGALGISPNHTTDILEKMEGHKLIHIKDNEFHLTADGQEYALRIIRAHRLWERYLADKTGFKEADWHQQAELREHMLTPEQADALDTRLGHPTHDPHGDPIPTPSGEMVLHDSQPLSAIEYDLPAHIVHIEDEPEAVYAQLVAEGLHPGMEIRVFENTPERIRFWADGDEHLLAPLLARNIAVVPVPQAQAAPPIPGKPLSSLQRGQKGRVLGISPALRGAERRRMMDLGILPGAIIENQMRSPSGNPTAYIIRGASIALRDSQAQHIKVEAA